MIKIDKITLSFSLFLSGLGNEYERNRFLLSGVNVSKLGFIQWRWIDVKRAKPNFRSILSD